MSKNPSVNEESIGNPIPKGGKKLHKQDVDQLFPAQLKSYYASAEL